MNENNAICFYIILTIYNNMYIDKNIVWSPGRIENLSLINISGQESRFTLIFSYLCTLIFALLLSIWYNFKVQSE